MRSVREAGRPAGWRLVVGVLAVLSLALVPAAVAFACTPQAVLRLDKSGYSGGERMGVSGSYFRANRQLTLNFEPGGAVGTVTTLSDGSFTTSTTAPSDPGSYTLSVIGYEPDGSVTPGLPARASFQVSAPSPQPQPSQQPAPQPSSEPVVLTSPLEGATVSSTPTLTWQLAMGARSEGIEYTLNPAPGDSGYFADDRTKRFHGLGDAQTTFAVGNREPLVPGRWFWHVLVSDPMFNFTFSAPRSFIVTDARPRIESYRIDYLACAKLVTIQFEHSDNSENAPRAAVEFRPVGRGRRVRRSLGQTGSAGLGGATEYESFRRPRKLRVGRSYRARLVLIDRARHVTKSRPRRVRIGRC